MEMCRDLWSALITSSSDRDRRTDSLPMFTVYYLTQVAQITENPRSDCQATVSLDDREMLYHDASSVLCTYHSYRRLDGQRLLQSVCLSSPAVATLPQSHRLDGSTPP